MVRGSSMSIAPVPGGGGQKSVDHLRRGGLADLRERRNLEEVLQALLGRFALVALPRHQSEQVSALGLAHRLDGVRCLRWPGGRVATRSHWRRFWSRWLIPGSV